MIKKWRAIIAIGCVCITSVVGCSKAEDVEVTNNTVEKTDQEEPTKAPEKEINTEKEDKEEVVEKEEPTVIRIGHPNISQVDPTYRDEVTGEPVMSEDQLYVLEQAMQAVLDEVNVQLEWVEYSGRPDEVILQTVLAGDPVADLAYMWVGSQGTVLTQNVLQPLDDYVEIFEGDYEWMLWDEVAGSRFFVNSNMVFAPLWPLVYNIDYIEQVDALKVDGETVYPTDLFLDGEWTWSVFEDYLAKIDTHFATTPTPTRPERTIEAYQTDYREAVLHATYANGSSIYGKEGLQVDTNETKEAVAYVQKLMNQGLLTSELWQEGNSEPGWVWNCVNFQNGETVFTNTEHWRIPYAAEAFAKRDQSVGIVPFPRPDDIPVDDPRYQQPGTAGDCFGVPKGVSPEKTELALKAFAVYNNTAYEIMSGGTALDYLTVKAETQAADYGIDVFHEELGSDLLETFSWMAQNIEINDYSQLTDIYYKQYMPIVGDSLYGMNGVQAYDVAIEATKDQLYDYVNNLMEIVQSNEIRDNIKPKFQTVQSFVFPVGTDVNTIQWQEYIEAIDGVDGELDLSTAIIDSSKTDFNTPGVYDGGFTATIKDKSGNEASANIKVTVYDTDHTVSPTITLKEEVRKIALEEDTSKIKWADDFIETAVDKDGLDIRKTAIADLSELDTTTPGQYDVALTVTDYVGNEAKVTLTVEVE